MIYWFDILVLYAIYVYNEAFLGLRIIRQRDLFDPVTGSSLVNDFLSNKEVDRIYAAPVTGNRNVIESVARLRAAGVLMRYGKYQVTQAGREFLTEIGSDYEDWPMQAPITNGIIDLSNAIPFPEL